jgi:hypothetical protein
MGKYLSPAQEGTFDVIWGKNMKREKSGKCERNRKKEQKGENSSYNG